EVARDLQRNLRIEDELVAAVGQAVDERGHDRGAGLDRQDGEGPGRRGGMAEEGPKDAAPAGGLVQGNADALAAPHRRADALHGAALGNRPEAAPLARSSNEIVEIRIVQRAHDHAQAEPGLSMDRRQELPVPEVARQEEDAPSLSQRLSDVLGAETSDPA